MASAVLIKHFYRNLDTFAKAEALRAAQLTVKRNNSHPSFWAGFTLVGDYR
jgi:CHAT domain-containing protein